MQTPWSLTFSFTAPAFAKTNVTKDASKDTSKDATENVVETSKEKQDSKPTAGSEKPELSPIAFKLNANPGIWFPERTALRLLEDVKLKLSYEKQIEVLDARLLVEKQRSELLRKDAEALEQIKAAFEQENTDLKTRLREVNIWWRSPYLWFTVGIIVGCGVTVGIVAAAK
jgi:hypothetical protein